MLQYLLFILIYTVMLFMWSFVYINKSDNEINQAYLVFLGSVLLWMILDRLNIYVDITPMGIVFKIIYFVTLLNMSVFFLYFAYKLIKRKIDLLFSILIILNTTTILSRFLFPIDYAQPNFWNLSDSVIAPLMSTIFSLPILIAVYLIFRQYKITKDSKQKKQLLYVMLGIVLATIISIISEYILPVIFEFKIGFSLMYFAILMLVLLTFISILKFKFLNVQADYIYNKLFLNSSNGIALINPNLTILSINNAARIIFNQHDIDRRDKITTFISDYNFDINYDQKEILIKVNNEEKYLSLTQYPLDQSDVNSEKLMYITDITESKSLEKIEKQILIEKSLIDPLTGLYNKKYVVDNYSNNEHQLLRNLIILFIDVDEFKSINDNYGHATGDYVLCSIAQGIKKSVRSNEIAIRFGGDEFLVILEGTGINEAYIIAERIRENVNSIDFSKFNNQLKVELSIGISNGSDDINEIIKRADKAMYQSKQNGKNRTSIFQEKSTS